MIITLIGMSGAGKSYWAKRLEKQGFRRISIDELIEAELGEEFSRYGSGLAAMTTWMGQPYDTRYTHTSRVYMDLEEKTTHMTLDTLPLDTKENIVIDTPGSTAYLPEELLRHMAQRTIIIYLHTPEAAYPKMFEVFKRHPKPIIWGDLFHQKPDESQDQALARCYSDVVRWRAGQYSKWANVTMDATLLRNGTLTVHDITVAAQKAETK